LREGAFSKSLDVLNGIAIDGSLDRNINRVDGSGVIGRFSNRGG